MIDLYLISVLLDAGAGTEWSYKSRENGRVYRRSEGIAVASLELFKQVRYQFAAANTHQSILFSLAAAADPPSFHRASSPETHGTGSRSTRSA
jgi:hypothetical protein